MEDQKPFDVRAKLAQELGRTPPEEPSSPKDYAPKRVRQAGEEYQLAQNLKDVMRDAKTWCELTPGEREALDLIATEMSRICAGRNFWKAIIEWATLGQEEADRD